MTNARYDPDKELWEAKSDKNPDFLAVTSGWLGLGSHQWTVHNDSKVRYVRRTVPRSSDVC